MRFSDATDAREGQGFDALLTFVPGIYLGSPLDDPKQTLGDIGIAVRGDGAEEENRRPRLIPSSSASSCVISRP